MGYSKPSKETMAKALPIRHYTHPMICDPLSYKWFPNRNNGQRRKQVPSDLKKERKMPKIL